MLARLGDVLYGTACVLAVLFAVIVSLTPGNDFKPENFIGVIGSGSLPASAAM